MVRLMMGLTMILGVLVMGKLLVARRIKRKVLVARKNLHFKLKNASLVSLHAAVIFFSVACCTCGFIQCMNTLINLLREVYCFPNIRCGRLVANCGYQYSMSSSNSQSESYQL